MREASPINLVVEPAPTQRADGWQAFCLSFSILFLLVRECAMDTKDTEEFYGENVCSSLRIRQSVSKIGRLRTCLSAMNAMSFRDFL